MNVSNSNNTLMFQNRNTTGWYRAMVRLGDLSHLFNKIGSGGDQNFRAKSKVQA